MSHDVCPIARTTNLMGDSWTPLLLREFLVGSRRFEQLQERLGVSRATLSQRLDRLVAEGFLEKREYQPHPPRFEYDLTEKGRAFWSVLAAMWAFGEDWLFDEAGAKIALKDRGTGRVVRPVVVDAETGVAIDVRSLRVGRRSAVETDGLDQAARPS
jgi:DNA-binding HxlR family transcriptional regulator